MSDCSSGVFSHLIVVWEGEKLSSHTFLFVPAKQDSIPDSR